MLTKQTEVVDLLLKAQADKMARDRNGNTPLHLAAQQGSAGQAHRHTHTTQYTHKYSPPTADHAHTSISPPHHALHSLTSLTLPLPARAGPWRWCRCCSAPRSSSMPCRGRAHTLSSSCSTWQVGVAVGWGMALGEGKHCGLSGSQSGGGQQCPSLAG